MSLKRFLDVVISGMGLLVLWPIVAVAALAVRATSPGPAIFAQTRVGRNEIPFSCLKLRTMWKDTRAVPTHEAPTAAVTPVGRLLRKTKIDELPQLWNVLVGEMSLVGPRPCLPTQHELIEARRRRGVFALRPGITGLAQVRGIDMSRPEVCAANDAEYLAATDATADIRILGATLIPGFPKP
jgi:O-antigen biosynthesis protein WbqP